MNKKIWKSVRLQGMTVILLLALLAGSSVTYARKKKTKKQPETKASVTEQTDTVEADGVYDTYPEVALYVHLYNQLPENYISKKEAQNLGWSGGSLEEYAPGKCIGGSHFGNYEGILPEEDDYTECDIETLGKSKRGAKRIVFSEDGDIYYTSDHYESFHLLYTEDGIVENCIVYDEDGEHKNSCREDHTISGQN